EIEKTPASTVFVLPNNKNIIMAAQQCVPLCPRSKIIVLQTSSVPEGISAMLAFDPEADTETNTQAMEKAAKNVTTAQVTYAARDSEYNGHKIKQGEYMSLIDGRLRMTDSGLNEIISDIASEISHRKCEFVSVFYGEDVTEEQAAGVEKLLGSLCPEAEISMIWGGQPVYYYIISGE
ncbi:MAG: DAK2 domain-containing protein, partial [Oscillospiraceae bacterium]